MKKLSKCESNIYIMIPYYLEKNTKINFESLNEKHADELSTIFLNEFEKNSRYECNNDIVNDLKRYFLERNNLYCFSDEYNDVVKAKEEIYMFLTEHAISNLCLLTLMISRNSYSTTQIQDQATSNVLYIDNKNGEKVFLDDYVYQEYGLKRCGGCKVLVSASETPKDELEFQYMLANESFDSNYSNYMLDSKDFLVKTQEDFSQYNFYQIYAARSAIVYTLKDFNESNIENIINEIPILFIMELIMFQQASILRTNKRIISELSADDYVSLAQIEQLYIEFGKTIKFWSRDMFKYTTSQILFDKINKAFETDKLLEDYKKNQSFLEHIVNLRDVQDSNRESKILNIIVLVLTIMQVIPSIISIVSWFHESKAQNFDFASLQVVGISSLMLVFIILVLKNNNRKKKEEQLK